MQEIFLKTPDNIKIAINHHKNSHDEVLIMAHGWFMTKDSKPFAKMAEIFCEDFDVISLDFRGHGRSKGFYTFSARERIDLKTVINYAKKQYKKIYLMGFSLGGALVIVQGAVKNVDKIIAVSPPSDFNKIENQMWKKEAWVPTLKKFEPKRWFSIRPSLIIRPKVKPIDMVDKIVASTLFIAGELDPTVHPWHTKALFDKAKCKKQFELFKGCLHSEDLFLQEEEKFVTLCKEWLKGL